MISGVKPRASGRNNVGQQLLAFLLFRDRWSVAQQCWRRLHSSSNIVGAMHAPIWLPNSSFQSRISCILPTIHCRSQHCWESLRLFVHHCQHGRNNSQHCWANNVGSCCLCLHVAQEYWKKLDLDENGTKISWNLFQRVHKETNLRALCCENRQLYVRDPKNPHFQIKTTGKNFLWKWDLLSWKLFQWVWLCYKFIFFFNFKWIVI